MTLVYQSTRDEKNRVTASQAILQGLATDGGLFTPITYPQVDLDFAKLKDASYQEVAKLILSAFLDDFSEAELDHCINHAYVPLDEALSRVVIDLSGRPGLVYNIDFTRALIGRFDVDLFEEFFHGLVNHSMMTLHIDNLSGRNAHHQAETVFKAFGRALRMAVEYDPRMMGQTPSTKGTLSEESVQEEAEAASEE